MANYERPPPYSQCDPHPKVEGEAGVSESMYHAQPPVQGYPIQPPVQGYPIQTPPQAYIPGGHPIIVPNYGSTTVVTQHPEVIFLGGCPACKVGILEDDFTWLGICCAVLFFPLGILCCFLLRQRRCANCNAVFG